MFKKWWNVFHEWLLHEEEEVKYLLTHEKKNWQDIRAKTRGYIFKKWFVPHPVNAYKPKVTHHHALLSYVSVLLALKFTFVVFFSLPMSFAHAGGVSTEKLLQLTNSARSLEGLGNLSLNTDLMKAARIKGEHMMEFQYWSHNGPNDISDPNYKETWDWFAAVGYSYQFAGENLAVDFVTSEGVHEGWMKSPTHRKNILDSRFREVGFAIIPGFFQGKETSIIVQMFGNPALSAPEGVYKEPVIQHKADAPIIEFPPQYYKTRESKFPIIGNPNANTTIDVLNSEDSLGRVDAGGKSQFRFIPSAKMKDGKHHIGLYGIDAKEYSKKHTVIIDTKAPKIDLASLHISESSTSSDRSFVLTMKVHDAPTRVFASTRYGRFDFIRNQDGLYETRFKVEKEIKEIPLILFAQDDMGNSATKTFTLKSTLEENTDVAAIPSSVSSDHQKTEHALANRKQMPIKVQKKMVKDVHDITSELPKEHIAKSTDNTSLIAQTAYAMNTESTSDPEEVHTWMLVLQWVGIIGMCAFVLFYFIEFYILHKKDLLDFHGHALYHSIVFLIFVFFLLSGFL